MYTFTHRPLRTTVSAFFGWPDCPSPCALHCRPRLRVKEHSMTWPYYRLALSSVLGHFTWARQHRRSAGRSTCWTAPSPSSLPSFSRHMPWSPRTRSARDFPSCRARALPVMMWRARLREHLRASNSVSCPRARLCSGIPCLACVRNTADTASTCVRCLCCPPPHR